MDFSWTDDQLTYRAATIRFAREQLNDSIAEHDLSNHFSLARWRKCAQFGILGLPYPEEYGGLGADIMTSMLAMEALGYGSHDNGLLFAMNAQMWSVQHPINEFGTPEQKLKYLPRLIQGEIIAAHGMSEPDSGSDAYNMSTSAQKCDDGYILNGTKTLITNAPVCNMAIVFASTAPAKGRWGISAFLVDRDTPGFTTGRNMEKMGLRTASMGELILSDCFVAELSRLGPEGAGAHIFASSMEWERSCILATNIGAMERQLEDCLRYSRQRRQFGQAIGRFQSISNRLAEMKVRLETARLMLYKVAWLKKQGRPAHLEAAMAKLYVSECFVQSSLDAIRIHGGYGYMTEFGIERDMRDAIGGTIYSGTSDIQRNLIVGHLCS